MITSVFFWDKYPFLRFSILLVIGISISIFYPIDLPLEYTLFFFMFINLLIGLSKSNFRIIACVYLIILGFFIHQIHNIKPDFKLIKHAHYKAQIVDFIETQSTKTKTIVTVNELIGNNESQFVKFKTVVYLPKNIHNKLMYGDELLITGTVFKMPKAESIYTFDFSKYWANQFVFFQSYPESYSTIKQGNEYNLFKITTVLRNNCDSIFRKHIKGNNEYAIVTAMMLGIRNHIDVDLKNAYSKVGVIHVIAISGLHIAVFFFIINGLFSKLIKSKKAVAIITLTIIWIYALITGMSPSVMRAVIMHSVILIGILFKRKTNLINNLSLSAFILLFYNPNNLIDIGFQLTFAAVFGIAIFNNLKSQKPFSTNYFVNYFYETACLTLIAQISLLPLLLYYFHSISFSFFVANLVIIPLSNFILYEGLALLLTTFFSGYITKLISSVLELNIQIMNKLTLFFYQIPFSNINSIYFTKSDCCILYGIILLIVLFIYQKKIKILYFIALLFSIFTINRIYEYHKHQKQNLFISYSFKNKTSICIINGFEANLFVSQLPDYYQSKTIESTLNSSFNSLNKTFLIQSRFNTNHTYSSKNYLITSFKEHYFLILKSQNIPLFKQKITYVQICNNLNFNWKTIIHNYNSATIVIDKSNNYTYATQLDRFLKKHNIKTHNMYQKGALVIN